MFNCAGVMCVATLSLALLDRDLNKELEKMHAALQRAKDFGFLPVDVHVIQLAIAKWTVDKELAQVALDGFKPMGFVNHINLTEKLIAAIKRYVQKKNLLNCVTIIVVIIVIVIFFELIFF